MVVQVEEAGKDGTPGAVNDLVRGTVDVAHRSYSPVFHSDVSRHQATLLVLGDDQATAEHQGHGWPADGTIS